MQRLKIQKLPLSNRIPPPILPLEMGKIWSQLFLKHHFQLEWPYNLFNQPGHLCKLKKSPFIMTPEQK